MITQSIRDIRSIEFGDIVHNKDTGEASRTLNIRTTGVDISIQLVCSNMYSGNLKILDYELMKVKQ